MNEVLLQALSLGGAAFMVGLSGAMSPGPYLTMTITRTLQHGRVSALLMLVGHAVLEATLLVGFAFGLQRVLAQAVVVDALGIIGGAVLLWMGGSLILGAVRGTIAVDLEANAQTSTIGPVAHGILVSLSNPYWTLWWATIGVTLAAKGLAIGPMGVVAFYVGHQLADVAWYGFVILAVSGGRKLLTPRTYRILVGVLAAFLITLGARFVLESML
ncbi:MAG: lysine transporter LysE [Actinobacteria bacterium HGW-Actinobacteria-9]|nr:MAG: lysine transporter LysE [Actinobacteria bacterium HGW-Actinobacteria-9]